MVHDDVIGDDDDQDNLKTTSSLSKVRIFIELHDSLIEFPEIEYKQRSKFYICTHTFFCHYHYSETSYNIARWIIVQKLL